MEREIKAEEERRQEKQKASEGQSKPSDSAEVSEEPEEVETTDEADIGGQEKGEMKESTVIKVGSAEEAKTEGDIELKQNHAVFYYWPILPQEHCKRWEIENAVMYCRKERLTCRIPPPPPDVSELDQSKTAKKNAFLWSLFKRSNR